MKKRKRKSIFIILILILLIFINTKSLIKIFYPLEYNEYILKYSEEYNLNPYLVAAVIKAESNFEKEAISKKNARGLMQLTPTTAEWVASKVKIEDFQINMLYQPEINIRLGCWYLNDLRREFGSDTRVILAAYNGGRGNVKKWLNSTEHSIDGEKLDYIPFKETDEYVKKVEVNYNMYKFLYSDDKDYFKAFKMLLSKFLL